MSPEQAQTWVPAPRLSPKEGLIVSYPKDRLGALSAPQQHLCKAQRASATQEPSQGTRGGRPGLACPREPPQVHLGTGLQGAGVS